MGVSSTTVVLVHVVIKISSERCAARSGVSCSYNGGPRSRGHLIDAIQWQKGALYSKHGIHVLTPHLSKLDRSGPGCGSEIEELPYLSPSQCLGGPFLGVL